MISLASVRPTAARQRNSILTATLETSNALLSSSEVENAKEILYDSDTCKKYQNLIHGKVWNGEKWVDGDHDKHGKHHKHDD